MARLFDDGSSEYLRNANEIASEPVTLACWVYPDDLTSDQNVMCHSHFSDYEYQRVWIGGDENVYADSHDGVATGATAATDVILVNTWSHIAAVFTSSTLRAVYLRGGNKNTNNTEVTPSLNNFAIGAVSYDFGPSDSFSGSIAEAAIWNAALTDAEVALLAAGFSPLFVRPQNLVAYWPLIRDEDQDRVGGYDLTAFNTPSIAPHPPIIYPAAQLVDLEVPSGPAMHVPRNPAYIYQVPAIV